MTTPIEFWNTKVGIQDTQDIITCRIQSNEGNCRLAESKEVTKKQRVCTNNPTNDLMDATLLAGAITVTILLYKLFESNRYGTFC